MKKIASFLMALAVAASAVAVPAIAASSTYSIKVSDNTVRNVNVPSGGTTFAVTLEYTKPEDEQTHRIGVSIDGLTNGIGEDDLEGSIDDEGFGVATVTYQLKKQPTTKTTITVTPTIKNEEGTIIVNGDVVSIDLIPECEGGHVKGAVTSTPATCTEPEIQHYKCTKCQEDIDEPVGRPLGHDLGEYNDYNAACHIRYCQRHGCGYYETEGHKYGEPTSVTPATDTEPGSRTYECSVCGHEVTEEIPIGGGSGTPGGPNTGDDSGSGNGSQSGSGSGEHQHDFSYKTEVLKPATCYETGLQRETCECGESRVVEIPKLEHKFEKEIERKNATHEAAGYVVMQCVNPGCTETQRTELPIVTEHEPQEGRVNVKEATCTEPGYTGDILCVGGEILSKGEETPALGHSFDKDGKCTRCGIVDPSHALGQTNPSQSSGGYQNHQYVPPTSQTGSSTNTNKPAKTSDNFDYLMWTIVMGFAIVGVVGSSAYLNKKKNTF